MVGSLGVALAVISLCVALTFKTAAWIAPLVAFGSMSLTMYCAHVISYRYLMGTLNFGQFDWTLWLWSAGIGIAVAFVWRGLFGTGPLERLLNRLVGKCLRFFRTDQLITPSPALTLENR